MAEYGTETIQSILRDYQGRKGVLLEIFHRVQHAYGYIPPEAMDPIAKTLGMAPSTVYGTLTFYTEFRTTPPPQVRIGMCLGPTCHVNGADIIKDILQYRLKLGKEGVSPDNACGIHVVQCAGHCHHAPLIYVNDEVRSNVSIADAAALAKDVQRLSQEAVS